MNIWNIAGLWDTHCHMSYPDLIKSIDEIVEKSKTHLNGVIDIPVDIETSENILRNDKYPEFVKNVVGIDPECLIPGSELFKENANDSWVEKSLESLENLINGQKTKIIGIGECGIDYYWLEQNKQLSESEKQKSKDLQKKLFEGQLSLGEKYKLPLSIHSRNAENECLEIVKNFDCRGTFHSFTGNLETAKNILDAGWSLGVNGIITFKNANDLRSIYKNIIGKISWDISPDDLYEKGIFFETDAPFLSPDGKRGEINSPENVKIIFDYFVKFLNQ